MENGFAKSGCYGSTFSMPTWLNTMKVWARNAVAFAAGLAMGAGFYKLFKREQKSTEAVNPEEYCAVFVVRKDLKMGKGKITAQCGHAALGIFQDVLQLSPEIADYWLNKEFPKSLYYCANEDVMDELEAIAVSNGYATLIIHDAGRTQIAAGSATVLAIAPVKKDDVKALIDGHGLVAIP